MRRLIIFLASAGYIGYIPVASGTFGSVVGVPLFWLWHRLFTGSPVVSVAAFAAAVLAACWIADRAEAYLQEHDSHKIVIDEVVGYVAATLFLTPSPETALLAFFVFRALDVIKPYPANYIDAHFPAGWGVVLDDVVSGFYANAVTRVVLWLWAMAG